MIPAKLLIKPVALMLLGLVVSFFVVFGLALFSEEKALIWAYLHGLGRGGPWDPERALLPRTIAKLGVGGVIGIFAAHPIALQLRHPGR